MATRTLKTSVTVLEPKRFSALIVTSRLVTVCSSVPEMIQEEDANSRPVGKDPEIMVHVMGSPVMDGDSEKYSSFSTVKVDSE